MDDNNTNVENNTSDTPKTNSHSTYGAPTEAERSAFGSNPYNYTENSNDDTSSHNNSSNNTYSDTVASSSSSLDSAAQNSSSNPWDSTAQASSSGSLGSEITPATTNTTGSAFIMPENNNTSESTSHQEVFGGTVEGTASNNYYTNTQANTYTSDSPEISKGFSIASLVMGILSILTCCCLPLAVILGILGIIFFCVQPKDSDGKRPTIAIVGLILSIVGIVISVGLIATGLLYSVPGASDINPFQ